MVSLEIANITTSIENQQLLVLDQHAKSGVFEKDARNRIIKYAGGFAVTYPYTVKKEKWAFRCWHATLGDIQKRLEIVSTAIQKANLSFLCDFTYTEKGISVDGNIYPTIRMRWIDGMSIKDYIYINKDNGKQLFDLSEKFLLLMEEMHKNMFAHGDLQHGNILVGNNGDIYLVDYDSFYCKELSNEHDIIAGLKDYQHPSRSTNEKVSEKLDYFSELIIYLSILAISIDHSLAEKYKINDSDRLLFEADDFKNLAESNIYKDLKKINDSKIDDLLEILEDYLSKSSIDELKPFDELLYLKQIKFDSDKTLIKENDSVKIRWNVQNAISAKLFANDKECESIELKGERVFFPIEDTDYKIVVNKEEAQTFEKHLVIQVKPDSEIELHVSKKFVFPGIPVHIEWHVKNAINVTLRIESDKTFSKDVTFNGQYELKSEKPTTVVLDVVDSFGTKTVKETIRLLPLPVIKLHANPPVIKSNMTLRHGTSAMNLALCKTPELPNVQVNIPFVKTVKLNLDLPHFVNLNIKDLTLWDKFKISIAQKWKEMCNTIKQKRNERKTRK